MATAALGLSEDLIATLTSDVTTYEDNNVVNGTTYNYAVFAETSGGLRSSGITIEATPFNQTMYHVLYQGLPKEKGSQMILFPPFKERLI